MRACEYCGASLEGRRTTARFCGDLCRFRAWEEKNPRHREQRQETVSDPETNLARRFSRDGKGVRVYLTPSELHDLQYHRHVSDSIQNKAADAITRLNERNR